MDDLSNPDAGGLGVFDTVSDVADALMHEVRADSPFSAAASLDKGRSLDRADLRFRGSMSSNASTASTASNASTTSTTSTASNRPVMLLPATEKPVLLPAHHAHAHTHTHHAHTHAHTHAHHPHAHPHAPASVSAASSTSTTTQLSDASGAQRKRRSKKNGLERKDSSATAGSVSDATSGSAGPQTTTNAQGKVIKRRAARACVSCRNRKVRCDVVETFPCGNCRWDKIECRVQEGRRRRRGLLTAREAVAGLAGPPGSGGGSGSGGPDAFAASVAGSVNGSVSSSSDTSQDPGLGLGLGRSHSHSLSEQSMDDSASDHSFASGPRPAIHADAPSGPPFDFTSATQQALLMKAAPAQPAAADAPPPPMGLPGFPLLPINGLMGDPQQQVSALLPGFIRPIPGKMAPEDIVYLYSKGAFTLPDATLQRALLHAYVEFVHPYMPLLELHPFLQAIHDRDGKHGTVSLLLYHAVMFTAASFVPARYLKAAGFSRRREARKAFFMKARALYDFDYETDRLTLVQALLLMTYWYETPDDQKDTWHWMGVAVSLAHTIGLHRDPRTTGEPPRRQRLRKLLWWCCFMRDRMIALGMRRPKRIRSEDADVPMLTPADFELAVLPDDIDVVPAECRLVRDTDMQEQLAELCVEKAKLCVLVGSMLQQQYTILPRGRQRGSDAATSSNNSTMMLFPNRPVSDDGKGNGPSVVDKIDAKLRAWLLALPLSCRYAALTPADVQNGRATIAVQRTLLHLVYHTTMSALHRPRIQPAVPGAPALPIEQQEFSRARVRDAADCVTRMGGEMLRLRLEPYLPTAGVTVFLPAMFAHLLDIKGGVPRERRQQAVLGFLTCMRVMESLRETYAAAEIAKGFVESLLKKAGIDLAAVGNFAEDGSAGYGYLGADNGGGTGTNTPVNGTSASLLNATSNVGVPYTEDGVAHAVAMYAANTPKASPRSSPPPPAVPPRGPPLALADAFGARPAGLPAANNHAGQMNNANVNANANNNNTNNANMAAPASYMPTPRMPSNGPPSINNGGQGLPMATNATSAMASANMVVEQMWGLTPSGSAVSEDAFEWDVTADPNSMKLDFDQWLDFPPEGMGSSTDHAFAGLFSTNFGAETMNTDF